LVRDELFREATWLIAAIRGALAARRGEEANVDQIVSALARQDLAQSALQRHGPRLLPACSLLPETVGAAIAVSSDVAAAIAAVEHELHWKQNPNYSDGAMGQPGYMDGYAYAEVVGPSGFFAGDDFLLGLLLIGPHRVYREHYHAAPELYWMLTGPSKWKNGSGGWSMRDAGSLCWHDPFVVHATATEAVPLLAIWAWARDVGEPARLAGH
ncbi:MAG: dimethylsulfoniopropionate lyase, partial [Pseudomonadota bacterium]|nr:dimethylsulfoniopropionate lyase [Pseudomonadota bacterium]